MKSYRELMKIAENSVDEMMKEPETALKKGVLDALDAWAILAYKAEKEQQSLSIEEKKAVYTKIGEYADRLIEPALHVQNEFGKLYIFMLLHIFANVKEELVSL